MILLQLSSTVVGAFSIPWIESTRLHSVKRELNSKPTLHLGATIAQVRLHKTIHRQCLPITVASSAALQTLDGWHRQ
jgi:hypothetical protein